VLAFDLPILLFSTAPVALCLMTRQVAVDRRRLWPTRRILPAVIPSVLVFASVTRAVVETAPRVRSSLVRTPKCRLERVATGTGARVTTAAPLECYGKQSSGSQPTSWR
jgi:hypothetical protein